MRLSDLPLTTVRTRAGSVDLRRDDARNAVHMLLLAGGDRRAILGSMTLGPDDALALAAALEKVVGAPT